MSDTHSQSQGPSEPPPLQLEILDEGNGRLRAILAGEIDFANATSLQVEIAAACVGHSAYALILDMAGVEFMDSSGLRTMLQLQHELTQAHGGLVLLSPAPQVRSILTLTGLDRRLPAADTLELAQASLAGQSTAGGDGVG